MTADDPVLRAALTPEVLRQARALGNEAYQTTRGVEESRQRAADRAMRDVLVAALAGRPEAEKCQTCGQFAEYHCDRRGPEHTGDCGMYHHEFKAAEAGRPDAEADDAKARAEPNDKWSPVAPVSPSGAGTWQPIETAPTDGTPILAFMPTYYQGKGGQAVVLWMDYSDRPGWYSAVASIHEPTHWQPLPAPPTPTTAQEPR